MTLQEAYAKLTPDEFSYLMLATWKPTQFELSERQIEQMRSGPPVELKDTSIFRRCEKCGMEAKFDYCDRDGVQQYRVASCSPSFCMRDASPELQFMIAEWCKP